MDLTNFKKQIDTFLEGKMNPTKEKAFKQSLKNDKELKKLFITTALAPPSSPTVESQKIRSLAAEIRTNHGPLADIKLSWRDHLRIAYQEWAIWQKMLLLVLPALLILVFGVGAIPAQVDATKIIEKYFQEPHCEAVAGGDATAKPLSNDAIYEEASAIYCGFKTNGMAELKQLVKQSTFNMAYYFLAHQELKNHQYAAAITGLKACLANRQILKLFKNTDQPDKLQLILALAHFGKDKSNQHLKNSLIQLNKHPDTTEKVRQEIESLLIELRHPYDIFGLW